MQYLKEIPEDIELSPYLKEKAKGCFIIKLTGIDYCIPLTKEMRSALNISVVDGKLNCSHKKEKQIKAYGRWGTWSAWVLDHSHTTDKFRSWICNNCNIGLGRFNDDIKKLNNAIKYLKSYDK